MKVLKLSRGNHLPPENQKGKPVGCAMELVSYIAGEPWSDHPSCTSPFLARLAIRLNDHVDDADRYQLTQFLPRLVGTRDDSLEIPRQLAAADFVLREIQPVKFLAEGRDGWAKLLTDLAPMRTPDDAGQHWLVVAKRFKGYGTGSPARLLAAVYSEQWGQVRTLIGNMMFGANKSFDLLDHVLSIGPGSSIPDDWFNRGAKLVGSVEIPEPVAV